MTEYLPLSFYIFLGAAIGGGSILLGLFIGFRSPETPKKHMAYECGAESIGTARIQFKVGYYLFALLFLIFDIESLFLFPCMRIFQSVARGELARVSYEAMLLELGAFIFILFMGLVYAWRKGVLKWE